ncbi:hypothetical protein FRB94_001171 [Tulasnella sp. JGI-2019a]|nr:hypothetical protein FRB94_001171 [Tulasnella sp. JGI-2019a]
MHEALKIPELVLRILNFANSAGDVYSIALVCRFFADLALEVLWTDWPVSVEGLLALLPDDLLYLRPSSDTKRSMISFQRSLVPRDWERIIDIGPSVKNLTYTERPEQLDSQVPRQYHPGYNLTSGYPKMATSQNVFYQLAFHRQSSHILPNLERLRWSAAPRLIILFLCPTLRALEMASSEYETGIFSEVEMRLSAANLKTLKLEVEEPSSHLDPTLEELSRLFEWAEELTDVTLSRGLVDSPVFISLSKLPQLRVLRIIGRLQSGLLFDFATTRGLARPSKAKRIKPAVPKAKSKWVTGRTPVATTGGWAAQSESDEWARLHHDHIQWELSQRSQRHPRRYIRTLPRPPIS